MSFLERLGEELEDATGRVVAVRAAAEQTAASPPAPLGQHSVLKYAVVEGAERYRRIMRVLCTEHRNFGLRLSPEAVGERLREAFEFELDPLAIAAHLDQLHTWGAVTREYDTSLARTARELRRNRFTYDISPAGKRTEELLEALDQLGDTVGALEGSRLPAIRDALRRIARLLDGERPSGLELRREFEAVTGEIERLHAGASDFMSSLNVVIVRSEQIDEAEFDRCKGLLIEHLEGFRAALRRHSDEIVEALRTVDRLDPERMVALIVTELELPELPGLPREQLAAQRQRELHGQWLGVRSWFVDEGGGSPWAALNAKVVDAIRAVLDIAERIVDHRANRADRARACEHLARLAHDATDDEAAALVAAAIGFAPSRHVSVPDEDPEVVSHPGSTGWLEAPPAPVVAHLRRPGSRSPGAGRG
ncbi:MAG: TIGR02677 family protein, partial [Thermoleophilaceae bacterium]